MDISYEAPEFVVLEASRCPPLVGEAPDAAPRPINEPRLGQIVASPMDLIGKT